LGLLAVLAAVALAAAPAPGASGRGERSYRLTEIREVAPPPSRLVTRAAWSLAADPNPSGHDVLAIGSRIVAFAAGGRMCGFDESTGVRRWCAGAGSGPAYAGGEVAFVEADGTVRAVGARAGENRWRHRFRGASRSAFTDPPPPNWPVSQVVWAAGDDFLTARMDGAGGHDAPNLGEIDRAGRIVWQTTVAESLNKPAIVPPYALIQSSASGARMVFFVSALRLGRGGGVIGTISDASTIADLRPPLAVVAGVTSMRDVSDYFLTYDVWLADVRRGKAVSHIFHFEPDFDANYDLYQHRNDLWVQANGKGRVAAEGDYVYVTVLQHVYRYRLADGETQRPLLLNARGWFVLGPYRGTVYVQRDDGVWALRAGERDVHARLVAPSKSALKASAIIGRVAYFAFEDGLVRGVDTGDGRMVLDAAVPGGAFGIGSSAAHVFFACGSANAAAGTWHVAAFPRPDAT
jgi:hypothetical protein